MSAATVTKLHKEDDIDVLLEPVEAAYLHAAVILPGGRTEGTLTEYKVKGLTIFRNQTGDLVIFLNGKKGWIPGTNVKIAYSKVAK